MCIFKERCKDIEEMPGFDSLLFFGYEEDEIMDKDDDDVKILPAIVDKIFFPKLTRKEDFCFLYSARYL